ncbi:cyclin A1,1 [Tanacetum coccineum]
MGSSSVAKRQAENVVGKSMAVPAHMAKKRPALANVTNQRPRNGSNLNVPPVSKISEPKKTVNNTGIFSTSVPLKQTGLSRSASVTRKDATVSRIIVPSVQSKMDVSPSKSDGLSVSMDETMSTCDSLNSPDVEYIDNNDIAAIESIERKTSSKLSISDHDDTQGNVCKREILVEMGKSEKIVDLDVDLMEPQLCATMACDIYQHLRASEAKKRPAVDFMENVQKDINPSMRAILIDWLVEVAEEYRLVPDTLYLTINYIDRFLSGNLMDRQRLQLLGVACMMIASKYEEICAPQVEEFCYITDNTYFKDEVLEMESSVLNFLKFEMTAPTVRCFLRRFVRAAQGVNEAPSMHLEHLASYIAELSLLEYDMLQYAPSLVAASAIFLARYVQSPLQKPWDSTLRHYTQYQPSDLSECVKALHALVCECPNSSLPAIREKYILLPLYFDNLSPPVSLKMSEEDRNVEVVLPVKSDMHSYSSTMTAKDVKALAFKHNIPLDLHPVALTAEWTMDKLPDDCIGLYEQYFEFSGVRVPFSTLLLAVLDHFRVHISQLVPIGLTRLTLFELYCRSLNIVPSVNLFRVFYKIGKQGDWFTFERRVGPGSGGKILNETFSGLKGWKKRFFFLDRRAIPQAMTWRHHDSDIHDPLPTDGFRASDVVTLTNQSIDIRPVPSGLLFHAGLATTWEFSGFLPIFKDTEGNVVTMSEYLRFPFLDGATIEQGDALSARDAITSHTTGPLPVNQSLPEKTARLKEVEIPDPKNSAGGEGGSKGKPKRRKVSAVRAEEEDSTEEASSANHDESFGESRGHGETVETHPADETRLTESPVPARNPEKTLSQDPYPADGAESSRPGFVYVPEWTIHRRSRVDTPEECRELLTHLAPPAVREEMNAYDNNTAMERAWFSIARGAMAQTDALLRFEALYDAHLALKERCEDVTRQLVSTRTDFTHVSNLYNTLSNRYQQVRGEHAGCAEKLISAERERDELRAVNADQASHIKELEAELARKDSALVFSDRISNDRAVENERLVSKLGYLEKEKTDSIEKLLPTVVRRLLNSHEYKESLSIPFNLAIQAGWAKGLAVKRSEEDLMDVLREVQGFDPHSDTRMAVEYDKLFTKTYPFVEKIFGLPRRTVQELLKMYPAPPPQDAPTKVNPSSQAPDSSRSVPPTG